MLEKAAGMAGWRERLKAVVAGPGWFPGTPRLGDPTGVPEVTNQILIMIENPQSRNLTVSMH